MKYTFEITIAGCSTNCAHCYVDGGPAPQMTPEKYKHCVDKLVKVFEKVDGDISLTLGNEIYCHRNIDKILSYTLDYAPQYFSFDNGTSPTTGIALLERTDRDNIIELLKRADSTGFMLALHAGEKTHDRTVSRKGAYRKLFKAADYFIANDLSILFNVIVSKNLCNEFDDVASTLINYPKAKTVFTIPNYVPTQRMKQYQYVRAEYDDCMILAEKAERWGFDIRSLRRLAECSNEKAIISALQTHGFCYEQEKQNAVQWKFFNVDRHGELFYGNVGAHTKHIGNVLSITVKDLIEAILSSEANYDYVAYYPDEVFHWFEKYIPQLKTGETNFVYKSKEECMYALFDHIGIKSAIL